MDAWIWVTIIPGGTGSVNAQVEGPPMSWYRPLLHVPHPVLEFQQFSWIETQLGPEVAVVLAVAVVEADDVGVAVAESVPVGVRESDGLTVPVPVSVLENEPLKVAVAVAL